MYSRELCTLTLGVTVRCTGLVSPGGFHDPRDAQMGVSFLSLLGDGLACSLPAFGCSLVAFVSGAPSLGGWMAPPRFSGSSSSCAWGSGLALCSCNRRSCTRSSMMASRSSWIAWFKWLFFIFRNDRKSRCHSRRSKWQRFKSREQLARVSYIRIYFNQFSCETEDINMNMQIRYKTLTQKGYNSRYKFCS